MTHDTEFEQWANKVWQFGAGLGSEVSLKDFRKDITIEFFNEAGQLVSLTKSIDAGSQNTKLCQILMRTPMRWRLSTSS